MKPHRVRLTPKILKLNEEEAREAMLPVSTYMRWKLGQEAPWKKLKRKGRKLALDAIRVFTILNRQQ